MTVRGMVTALALLLFVMCAGCAVLPPSPEKGPPAAASPTRTVTCMTRDLSDGLHFRFLTHKVQVADPSVIAFLSARPALGGRLLLGDLLFLERLAETRHRHLLLAADDPAGDTAAEPAPVARLKLRLVRTALRCPDFLRQVAALIDDDVQDSQHEHGGLVLLADDDECPLRMLPVSSTAGNDEHAYGLPTELFTASSLAVWHIHAAQEKQLRGEAADDRAMEGPSGTASGSLAAVWGDVWIAYLRGIDGLVFTPAADGTFSVVFFSSDGQTVNLGRSRRP